MDFNIRRRDAERLLAVADCLAALGTPAMAHDASVTESDGAVDVLNAPSGGAGPPNNVVGLRNVKGVRTPLVDGTCALGDGSLPAQVSFDNEGDVLLISERASNLGLPLPGHCEQA